MERKAMERIKDNLLLQLFNGIQGAAFRIPGLRIVTVWAVMSAPLRPDNHTNTGTIYKAVLLHRGSQSDGFAIHALHDPVLQMPLHH